MIKYVKNRIPCISPFRPTRDLHLRYIIIHRKWDKATDETLYSALSYGWEGWTDGAVWLVNQKPSLSGTNLKFTNVIVLREDLLENYMKYKYISSVPSLFYAATRIRMSASRLDRDALIFADAKKSIAIWRPHVRVFYTTFGKNNFSLWIHPVLDSYTVTVGDTVVGFGIGIPEETVVMGSKTLTKAKRDAVVQIRKWWQAKAENELTDENPELLFPWKTVRQYGY